MDPSQNALAIVGPSKPRDPGPDRPLPMDGPEMDKSAEPITLDLTALSTVIEPPGDAQSDAPRGSRFNWDRLSPLAASLVFAAALGVLAGTAGTAALLPEGKPAPVAAAATDDKPALEERVARLSAELASIKAGIETSNKTTASQLGRIGERLDRAEKAQAEPAARLAKIMESLDRLERRTATGTLPPPEVTGSVSSVAKIESKPLAVNGWRLRDFHAGRALLESRTGTLYEVGPGSNIPGLGRIEAIKRVDGRIVVSTAKGIITSAADLPRRPAYHLPPGY